MGHFTQKEVEAREVDVSTVPQLHKAETAIPSSKYMPLVPEVASYQLRGVEKCFAGGIIERTYKGIRRDMTNFAYLGVAVTSQLYEKRGHTLQASDSPRVAGAVLNRKQSF